MVEGSIKHSFPHTVQYGLLHSLELTMSMRDEVRSCAYGDVGTKVLAIYAARG